MRSKHFIVRMTDVEFTQAKADAVAANDTASNWVRRCLALGRATLLQGRTAPKAAKKAGVKKHGNR